ncbi:ABC transporter substrate-binding protein [Paracoccus versutus]|uniref:Spermidine/putrescine transport system substrate-binding protein n=1 Tax=Paracoccus versutus TaxID=34007 RepID=A0AAQ0KJA5_PARVE|nr:ABC transporter substrate-binding protein [Paracoccus versutus]KGJ02063.1 hypothetical protein IT40_26435 [Paracoccus versutus]REG26948.1 putative spermidine/putrescine transport system substrate-binding protein [Paracoccus versutus]WEJ79222.1 ABC transporter substrate-binding protein [Paracoccus versutus]
MQKIMKDELVDILRHRFERGELGRRDVLMGLGLLGVTSLAFSPGPLMAQSKQLVLATWGGDTTKAIEEILGNPFGEVSGLSVVSDTSGPSEGAVQVQASSGSISWDVMLLEYFSSITLGKKGLLGEIEYDIVDRDKVFGGQAHQWGVASHFNSYVMVYDAAHFGDNPPKTWADFFDVEKFPGKHTFPKWMMGILEAALLADGVQPDGLYPLDLDRAFAKVEKLMPHVVSVWGTGAESQQLMLDGDAVMGMLWGTRAILVDRDSEQEVTFTFQDGFLAPDAWGYMKDNPAGAKAANEFIAFTQDPARQVELLRLAGYGPANPEASSLVPDDLKRIDCNQPENRHLMHDLDMEWYSENYATALDRFTALIAS